jgi:plastocyanin
MKKSVVSKSRYFIGIAILTSILLISNSCSKSAMNNMYGTGGGTSGTGVQGANEVLIQNMAFTPATITVNAGTTVTWTNKDAIAHTVTSDNGLFNSGNIGSNGTYSYTFPAAGSFPYHCSIHTTMKGTVVVNPVMSTPGY